LKERIHPKEKNKGITCMVVRHAHDHAGDCCVMCDENTMGIRKTRDVTWFKHMFYEPAAKPNVILDIEMEEGAEEEASPVSTAAVAAEFNEAIKQLGRVVAGDPRIVMRSTEQLGRVTTKDGRISSGRIQALNLATVDATDAYNTVELTMAEEKYYDTMAMFPKAFGRHEICFVGAGIGSGMQNTMELHTNEVRRSHEWP
jgi:hypothetical protein